METIKYRIATKGHSYQIHRSINDGTWKVVLNELDYNQAINYLDHPEAIEAEVNKYKRIGLFLLLVLIGCIIGIVTHYYNS
jgi:hypothetical protein